LLSKCASLKSSFPAVSLMFHVTRNFSSTSSKLANKYYKVPPLMDFPTIVSPNLVHTIRNRMMARFLITPYFDNDFSIKDFDRGAHHAAVTVSNSLAQGDIESVDHLITPEAVSVIERNLSMYTNDQRSLLTVQEEDVYFTFIYQIGIMMEDHPTRENESTRHVEITWGGHHFPNYVDLVADIKNPIEIKKYMDERGGPMVFNYRFIKDFTKGVEDSWTINAMNQFFLGTHIEELED